MPSACVDHRSTPEWGGERVGARTAAGSSWPAEYRAEEGARTTRRVDRCASNVRRALSAFGKKAGWHALSAGAGRAGLAKPARPSPARLLLSTGVWARRESAGRSRLVKFCEIWATARKSTP